MSTRDELAGVLADTINKQFKDMKVAYFLDGSDTTPTDIKDFVSTGSTMLDLAISNKPNGGIAVGRITELNGLESSGKSLIGAHILAETQKKGGVAVYIDTETAVSTEFLRFYWCRCTEYVVSTFRNSRRYIFSYRRDCC